MSVVMRMPTVGVGDWGWPKCAAMIERRRVSRTRISVAAKVLAVKSPRAYDCIVRNNSSLGARVEFSNAAIVPNIFELTFDNAKTLRVGHVVWRTRTELGVEFA
jgi:hypothetical protein